MSKHFNIELDGREVRCEPGETLWRVARREGVEIPHLCYRDEPGYRSDGNCRAQVLQSRRIPLRRRHQV